MSLDDLDRMLSGGAPGAFKKADPVGSIFEGTVTEIRDKQEQREYRKDGSLGPVKTYDNGDIMWQIPVVIKTDRRDPSIPNDDGSRTLYLKGKLLGALKQALREAGGAKLRVGGHLWVQAHRNRARRQSERSCTRRSTRPRRSPQRRLLSSGPAAQETPSSAPQQQTQAASIAAKLAAAQATPTSAATVADLAARFGIDEKAAHAIKNMSKEQAGAVGLADQWNALQTAS